MTALQIAALSADELTGLPAAADAMAPNLALDTTLAASGTGSGPNAAGEAVAHAVGTLAGPAGLILAFPSGIDPARAAWQLAEAADGVPAAGMTGSGSFGPDGFCEEACTALAFERSLHAGVAVRSVNGDLERAAHRAVRGALADVDPDLGSVVICLFLDPMSGDQADAVRGAYEVAGSSAPMIGGGAGGDQPSLLTGRSAHTDSVVAVAMVNPGPVGLGIAHGCRTIGAPSIATRAEGARVLELDGRPAAEVYLEKLGIDADLDDDQFRAISVNHPLGQPELTGQSRLRHVFGRTREGALRCATAIPRDAAIEFTAQDLPGVNESARRAVGLAQSQLGPQPARAALIFDCASRKLSAAGRVADAVGATLAGFGESPPPLAGCFTHGEIARGRGAKGDRNHAIVVCAFG